VQGEPELSVQEVNDDSFGGLAYQWIATIEIETVIPGTFERLTVDGWSEEAGSAVRSGEVALRRLKIWAELWK
jgi:hypothetical protein